MSLAGSKVGMRYLCVLERDPNIDSQFTNSWGSPNAPAWTTHVTVPCSAWSTSAREVLNTSKTVVAEDRIISLPLGTDVSERDRVVKVTTEAGENYWEGPMLINSVLRHGDHIEIAVETHR